MTNTTNGKLGKQRWCRTITMECIAFAARGKTQANNFTMIGIIVIVYYSVKRNHASDHEISIWKMCVFIPNFTFTEPLEQLHYSRTIENSFLFSIQHTEKCLNWIFSKYSGVCQISQDNLFFKLLVFSPVVAEWNGTKFRHYSSCLNTNTSYENHRNK